MLKVTPTFNVRLMGIRLLLRQSMLLISLVGFFVVSLFNAGFRQVYIPSLVCMLVVIVGWAAGYYLINQVTYRRRALHFYGNKVEFLDGFFNKQRKVVSYKNIREVVVEQGFLQEKFNMGTLSLITAAHSGVGSSGVKLTDVENINEIYEQVRRICAEVEANEAE